MECHRPIWRRKNRVVLSGDKSLSRGSRGEASRCRPAGQVGERGGARASQRAPPCVGACPPPRSLGIVRKYAIWRSGAVLVRGGTRGQSYCSTATKMTSKGRARRAHATALYFRGLGSGWHTAGQWCSIQRQPCEKATPLPENQAKTDARAGLPARRRRGVADVPRGGSGEDRAEAVGTRRRRLELLCYRMLTLNKRRQRHNGANSIPFRPHPSQPDPPQPAGTFPISGRASAGRTWRPRYV